MTEKGSVVTPDGAEPMSAAGPPAPAISEDEVLRYLAENPDLLARHPRLLETQALPSRTNGNVVDMQHMLMQRLREENIRLRETCETVIGTARYNRTAQTRIHDGVLRILSAGSFEKLIGVVTTDLPLILDVDAITICLEAGDAPIPRSFAASLRSLPEGAVEGLLGPGRDIAMASNIAGDAAIFGPAAGLIRSQALTRLCISDRAPKGLLALGAREDEAFHQNHGGELISFLTRVLEAAIRRWLTLPG